MQSQCRDAGPARMSLRLERSKPIRGRKGASKESKLKLEFPTENHIGLLDGMKISADTGKAISVILFYSALLFGLLGFAARMKMNFHGRLEISTASFVTAAVLAALAIVFLIFSFTRKA
jgi:hypothetical protein